MAGKARAALPGALMCGPSNATAASPPPDTAIEPALAKLGGRPEFAEGEPEQAAALGLRPLPRLSYPQVLALAELRFGEDHVLFEFPDENASLTVGRLRELSDLFAAGLRARGLGRGDSIAIWSPPAPVWPVAMFGAASLGVRVCGLNTRYRAEELSQVLGLLDPAVVLVATGFLRIDSASLVAEAAGPARRPRIVTAPVGSELGGLRVPGPADAASGPHEGAVHHREPALVQFTSGSTAAPKGVLITQSGSVAAAHYGAECLSIRPGDRMYSPLPFFHIGGTVSTALAAVTSGCTMVIPRRFDPADALTALAGGCTAFQGHGALWRILLDTHRENPRPLPRLRTGWASGDAAFLAELWHELGVTGLVNMFGSSEAGTIACTLASDSAEIRLGTLGHPTPGTRVRVLDPLSGEPVAPGEVGELTLAGPMVMLGYLGGEQVGEDGIRTGDLVSFDGDVLRYAGRADDRLKPGGENVSPAEVEEFIRRDPAVAEVVVVGVPDHRLGEVPAALVRFRNRAGLDPAAAEKQVAERCRAGLAGFKVPRHVLVVDALPTLDSGKVDRRRIRAEFIERFNLTAGGRG
ncbi:class I adenylate-forming enzyme family protein [Nonomuraea fuscirosea]|uniref:class I adenylate-forming enzyme family protein n=1 Tax=Nonomuraea fuscirosea TaxID=1291556 RepID=UPI003421F35F